MKILQFGDVHANNDDLDEIERCTQYLLQVAHEERPDLIIDTGDIFDSRHVRADAPAVKYIHRWIKDLADIAPIARVMGTYSHDGKASEILDLIGAPFPIRTAVDGPLQLLLTTSGSLITEEEYKDALSGLPSSVRVEAVISLMPAPTKEHLVGQVDGDIKETDQIIAQAMTAIFAGFAASATKYDAPHILVGHWNTTGAYVSETQMLTGVDIEVSKDQMAMANAALILLGHIHKRQQIGSNIFYNGSSQINTWGELDAKGFFVHELIDGELSSRFIETPTRRRALIKYDFTLPEAVDENPVEALTAATIKATSYEPTDSIFDSAMVRFQIKFFQDEEARFDDESIRGIFPGAHSVDVVRTRIVRANVRSTRMLELERLSAKIEERAEVTGEKLPDGALAMADMIEDMEPEEFLRFIEEMAYDDSDSDESVEKNPRSCITDAHGRKTMVPLFIRLRGFKGIRYGLGVDEISLDLSGLSGLVALTGENGAGKTTFLEQLQPFPQVISRPNPALINHVLLRDSEKEQRYQLNGSVYRSLVKIDAHSGRSEGYLWEDGVPVVKGKISAFSGAITELFGSPKLFFNSVFDAQGSAKMSDMKPSDFKKLIGEFLRLNRYFTWEDTSKKGEGIILRAIARIDKNVERVNESIKALNNPSQRKNEAEASLSGEIDQKGNLEADIEKIKRLQQEARDQLAKNEKVQISLDAESKSLADIDVRLDKQSEANRKATGAAEQKVEATKKIVSGLQQQLESAESVDAAAAKLKSAKPILASLEKQRDDAIRDLRTANTELAALQSKHQAERKNLEENLAKLRDEYATVKQSVSDFELKIAGIDSDISALNSPSSITRLETEIKGLERQSDLLKSCGNVTFHPDPETLASKMGPVSFPCNSEDCAFIQSALEAADKLPPKQKELANEKTRIASEIDRLKVDRERVEASMSEAQKTLEGNINTGKKEKAALKEIETRQAGEMNVAEKKRDDLQTQVDGFGERITKERNVVLQLEKEAARSEEIRIAREQLPAAETALNEAEKSLETTKGEAGRSVAALIVQRSEIADKINALNSQVDKEAAAAVNSLEDSLRIHRADLEKANESITASRTEITRLNQEVAKENEFRKDLDRLKNRRDNLTNKATVLAFMKNQTGPNGLRQLEIDAAAPSVSSYGNDLLAATYGPAHSLQLCTQDENGKEILLPMVTREDGSSEVIGQFSGGEKTWDLKALRLALTLVAKQKSGRDFRTAFADEEDGALDKKKAKAFIAMYREFLRLGNFILLFFSSHKPECVAMADHRIVFNGGISIQ